jgi:DNA-binding Xre family transcriptional regulator
MTPPVGPGADFQAILRETPSNSIESSQEPLRAVLPGSAHRQSASSPISLTPLVCDHRAITKLLERLIESRGLTIREVAHRMGMNERSLQQYTSGRRSNPTLMFFLKLCEAAGVRVAVELSPK